MQPGFHYVEVAIVTLVPRSRMYDVEVRPGVLDGARGNVLRVRRDVLRDRSSERNALISGGMRLARGRA